MATPGDVVELSYKISKKLNCGLSKDQLGACLQLIEEGATPEAVAHVVKHLGEAVEKRRNLDLK
jgi:predicted secreted protein